MRLVANLMMDVVQLCFVVLKFPPVIFAAVAHLSAVAVVVVLCLILVNFLAPTINILHLIVIGVYGVFAVG